MRVLHVSPTFPPTWAYGGIPRAVGGLCRAQAAAGLDVRVWSTDALDQHRRNGLPLQRQWEGVEVVTTPLLSNRFAWEQQLYLPTSAPPMDGVDLLHLHGHRHLLNAWAYREARRHSIPVVMTPHGTAPRIERKQLIKRVWDTLVDGHVPQEADRVIALSKAELRDLLRLGLPSERLVHIPNGLEWEDPPPRGRFRQKWSLGDTPIVAYLGQVSPRKGVEHLVRAFAEGGLEPARLVIAGPLRGMVLDAPGVLWPGVLEGEERLELLVDADVLAYPSTQEVFGLVPLEGLLCGTPVVVGGDCGCGELIGEAGAGLLVPHGDVPALKRAITRLLQDRQEAGQMVEKGRRFIKKHLDYRDIAARHLDLYRQVLG